MKKKPEKEAELAKRRGRPKGSRETLTREGAPIVENLNAAVWGHLDGKDGVWLAHEIWLRLNPPADRRAEMVSNYGEEGADLAQREAAMAQVIGEAHEIVKRVGAGDFGFFQNFAAMVQKLSRPVFSEEPARARLLAYVGDRLSKDRSVRFTMSEFYDPKRIRWPVDEGGCPDERTMRRYIRELGIPMTKPGRPRKS